MLYNIKNIHSIESRANFLYADENGREINIYTLNSVVFTGYNLYYPNILAYSKDTTEIYAPINEQVMSLKSIKATSTIEFTDLNMPLHDEDPCFFFVYNTDNYYHFLYDTLPYLITYLHLRETEPRLKLLMNYPNSLKTTQYNFVKELLELLNINSDDIKVVRNDTVYKTLYISDSYTHGVDSNLPPRCEVYKLYNTITEQVLQNNNNPGIISNIYVSRRSWLHNNLTNIGTDYTTRRRLVNEDELINYLQKNKYQEVFTETLNTIEKILLFANARYVIGAIGGGLCNALYSNNSCNLISLNSPGFLDINKRFEYSFKLVNYTPFNDTYHESNNEFKLFMRVLIGNTVGEIIDIGKDTVTISYTKAAVAGWNKSIQYDTTTVLKQDVKKLDEGLNSPWCINMNKFKKVKIW
jgi:hypothetical protein